MSCCRTFDKANSSAKSSFITHLLFLLTSLFFPEDSISEGSLDMLRIVSLSDVYVASFVLVYFLLLISATLVIVSRN